MSIMQGVGPLTPLISKEKEALPNHNSQAYCLLHRAMKSIAQSYSLNFP